VSVAVAKLGPAYLALGSSPGDQRLLDTVRRLGITCLIRAVGVDLPSGLAGEQIPLPVLDSGQPTVATIFCATWRLNGPAIGPGDTAGPPPIGRPVDGVKISGVRVEPAEVDVVPEFPLTSRGKINRAAVLGLRPSQSGQNLPDSADGPEVQDAILRICRDLLGQPAVSIGHSFADVGGNSLAAAMMLKAIEAEFGVRLRAVDVLRQPDLRSLARLIESWRAPTASETSPS
jgi:acyl carrier protein